jgi:hypothetical protein
MDSICLKKTQNHRTPPPKDTEQERRAGTQSHSPITLKLMVEEEMWGGGRKVLGKAQGLVGGETSQSHLESSRQTASSQDTHKEHCEEKDHSTAESRVRSSKASLGAI